MEPNHDDAVENSGLTTATGTADLGLVDSHPDISAFREVVDPTELEAIVQQNPVLTEIRAHGGRSKREEIYPADSTAEYVYTFLEHFPPGAYALPQTFRKVIRGLHAGHWLSKKIEEIKNRRWRRASKGAPYGKLSPEEAAKLQRHNPAFWHLYVQKKPSAELMRKRQEQYDKKTAHNKNSRVDRQTSLPPPPPSVAVHAPLLANAVVMEVDRTNYTEIVDPGALERLEAIVKMNPVLLKIREYGPTAKREDVFPTSSTLEAEEYVYTFLRHFPENTFALPQVFRKCVKSLNSSHWLAKKIEELKNRRWRIVPGAEYGRLSSEEVTKIKAANPAFWACFIQNRPSDEVLLKKQAQYDKKTASVKQARTGRPTNDQSSSTKPEEASKSPTSKSKKSRLVNRASVASRQSVPAAGTYTELQDPTATEMLESIVVNNPVLTKIRECGVKAKREQVYPSSATLEAEEYVFTYLKHFPENTFALPPTFRKVVKGLNASHWLAKKVIEMKDRRWRMREGQDSEFGRMTQEEVDKIKSCNPAFWECYINKRPPDDVLRKKRKQYERKTEHNKNSRASKKPKLDEIVRKATEEAVQQVENQNATSIPGPAAETVGTNANLSNETEMDPSSMSEFPVPNESSGDVAFL